MMGRDRCQRGLERKCLRVDSAANWARLILGIEVASNGWSGLDNRSLSSCPCVVRQRQTEGITEGRKRIRVFEVCRNRVGLDEIREYYLSTLLEARQKFQRERRLHL